MSSSNGHHVAPISLYLLIFGALMVGTILTVVVAKFDLGPLNNIVMLAVASAKALLVVLYFMHVRWSSRLTWVVASSGFFLAADHVQPHDGGLREPRLGNWNAQIGARS
jgi:cytochrome c oxidase subunit 4